MSDLIRRGDAIRVVMGLDSHFVQYIEELPTAEPEFYDYSDIDDVWEFYAKEHDINLTDGAKQLKDAMWVGYRKGKQDAQPEREKGEWLESGSILRPYMCPNCGTMFNVDTVLGKPSWGFCPNCGAEMEVENALSRL